MKSNDRPYDDLKRHVPTNLALGAALISAAMPVLGATFILVPHGHLAARSSPLYWVLMAPLALWAWGAISFDPWAIRLLTPLLVAAPLLAAMLAVVSSPSHGDAVALWSLTAISGVVSVLGGAALSRSRLWPLNGRSGRY